MGKCNEEELAAEAAFESFCRKRHRECSFWKKDRKDCSSREICKETFLEGDGRIPRATCQSMY